jgi:hypothetical protein
VSGLCCKRAWEQAGNKFPQVRACTNSVPMVHVGNGLLLFSQLDGTFEPGPTRKVFP